MADDDAELKRLVASNEPRIARMLRRRKGCLQNEEDLKQEVLLKLVERWRKTHVHALVDYPIPLMTNGVIVDAIRREKAFLRHCPRLAVRVEERAVDPSSDLELRELQVCVRSALDELNPKQREAIEAQLSPHETDQKAADRLCISIETYRSRKKAGMKKLRVDLRGLSPSSRW